MNQYEILLDVLQYVQGEVFSEGKIIKLGGYSDNKLCEYSNNAYAEIKLLNGDVVKVEIGIKENEVKEDGN